MAYKILCVAEKPAIAKSVANHLGGGNVNVVSFQPDKKVATKGLTAFPEKCCWNCICEEL